MQFLMVGEGGVGTDVPTSKITPVLPEPSFLQVAQRLMRRSQAAETTNTEALSQQEMAAMHSPLLNQQYSASSKPSSMTGAVFGQYKSWRTDLEQNPREKLGGLFDIDREEHNVRFLHDQDIRSYIRKPENVDEDSRIFRFEQVLTKSKIQRDAAALEAIQKQLDQEEPVSPTEPGPVPKNLIKFLIKVRASCVTKYIISGY